MQATALSSMTPLSRSRVALNFTSNSHAVIARVGRVQREAETGKKADMDGSSLLLTCAFLEVTSFAKPTVRVLP